MKRKWVKNRLTARQNLYAYAFLLPWIIGVIAFFLLPMGNTVRYVFNKVAIGPDGLEYTFTGWETFRTIFVSSPDAIKLIAGSIGSMFLRVVMVLFFSLFMAIVLNQSFKGRAFSRMVLALPIIVSSGVLLAVFKEDLFAQSAIEQADFNIFQGEVLRQTMLGLGLTEEAVTTVTGYISTIIDMIWFSGVQLLLFLAALQSIPRQLYEVCAVEGSTPWQTFWLVTFPLISPFLLLNTFYTVIDYFTDYSNPVMARVTTYFEKLNYSYSATLALVYFLIVGAVVGVIGLIMSRRVFYMEK